MPLPSSGSISLSQVNTELGLSATATISMNSSNVRTLFGKASGAISMSDGRGKANEFAFTISSNQTNANLRTLAINAGWNQSSKVVATINSGVYISSNSTGTPALVVNGSFPNGVTLNNNGFIVGMGGAGGAGSGVNASLALIAGSAGSSGGLALSVSSAVTINNAGTIAGGGGGGGGGRGYLYQGKSYNESYAGSGGGGGRSGAAANSGGGAAGLAGAGGPKYTATAGGAGTVSAPGSGGSNQFSGSNRAGMGGSGGGWGAGGASGDIGNNTNLQSAMTWCGGPYSGGGGGAVAGNSNITWTSTGTRLGGIS